MLLFLTRYTHIKLYKLTFILLYETQLQQNKEINKYLNASWIEQFI